MPGYFIYCVEITRALFVPLDWVKKTCASEETVEPQFSSDLANMVIGDGNRNPKSGESYPHF